MKIFLASLRMEKRSTGIYRVDFLLKVMYSIIAMYGVRSLWAALYAQDPSIVGRPLSSMITYAMLALSLIHI